MRERTGAWMVTVTHDGATAHNTRTNAIATTTVIRFPVGWRVGLVWSSPVPKSVGILASRLAKRMTRGEHNAAVREALGGRPATRTSLRRIGEQ